VLAGREGGAALWRDASRRDRLDTDDATHAKLFADRQIAISALWLLSELTAPDPAEAEVYIEHPKRVITVSSSGAFRCRNRQHLIGRDPAKSVEGQLAALSGRYGQAW